MRLIAPDYLDRLGIPPNVSEEELEKVLAAQEARCKVLLKIPLKRLEAASRLELIQVVRNIINSASISDQPFELPPDLEQDSLYVPPSKNKTSPQTIKPLIFETNKVTNEGEIGQIRSILNQWATSIPHHEYLTFGNDITILDVEERPTYLVEIKYLLETREVLAKQKPYLGEALPTGIPLTERQIALWDIKTPDPIGFEPNRVERDIAASRQKVTCVDCDGEGKMWCVACRSTGQVACKECGGRYQYSCPSCSGRGQFIDSQKVTECKQCRGIGIAICGYCREGLAQCPTCQGYRQVSCVPCNSKGELLNYFTLLVKYKPQNVSAPVFCSSFPEYARKQFNAEIEKQVVFHQDGERYVNAKPINELKYTNLQVKIIQLVEKYLIKDLGGQENLRVNKHSIEIKLCPTVYVKYSFENVEYELWIVGTTNQIYTRTSPIHEYDKKLSKIATELLSKGDLPGAIELLSDAFRHTPNSASALVVVNECVKKLQEALKIKNYSQVIVITSQAQKFLGDKLAINFLRLSQQAALTMRLEYLYSSFGVGILTILVAYILMGINGHYYGRSAMVQTSLVLIIVFTGVGWFLATQLAVQIIRILLPATISVAVVVSSGVLGLIEQDNYLARRKQEIVTRFDQTNYQASKAAIDPLEQLINDFPKDVELRLMLGRFYVKATYYEKAIQALTVGLTLTSGKSPEIHNELGVAFLGKGDKTSAIKHFRDAINLRLPDRYKEAYKNLALALNMGYIEGGTFGMGRSDGNPLDAPPHNVTVEPFMIDQFEVTNSEYWEFVKDTKYPTPNNWVNGQPIGGTEKMPVVGINLADANAFANWRAEKTQFPYRLPNEPEWELATRGIKTRSFPWGEEWNNSLANVKGKDGRLTLVGSFPKGASPEGIQDLIGNAAEWVDGTLKAYPGSKALVTGQLGIIRGGAYDSLSTQVHGGSRLGVPIEGGDYHNIGFRCVISADKLKK